MTLSYDLSGHTAIVTGANHGIGAATAQLLAERRARVLLTYLRLTDETNCGIPEEYGLNRSADASVVLSRIRDAGGRALALEADLADRGTPGRLFDLAEKELGHVDILVNNASGWLADTFSPEPADRYGRDITRVTEETFDRQFAVDARASAAMISEFARRHAARGGDWGRIIGLTSGGRDGFPGEVSYGAAKAALENYTMSAAFELSGMGITANVVYPPVTDTGWVTDKVREDVAKSYHLIHVATPFEVAEVICYLASDDAKLITGNIIRLR